MNHKKLSERASFLIRFAYDGSHFMGVQEQPGLPTVLGVLRQRINECAGQEIRGLFVAARTDRGVHALENYATFYLASAYDHEHFIKEMLKNQHNGVFIRELKRVCPHTHARGNSRGKIYRYSITDGCHSSEQSRWSWHIVPELDIEAMKKAASYLIGEHDFSSFRGGGCGAHNPVKILSRIDIERVAGGCMVAIEIHGNAFLRYMVRNIVGLLIEIGAGVKDADEMPAILSAKSRLAAGIMAPAHALCLIKVGFENS